MTKPARDKQQSLRRAYGFAPHQHGSSIVGAFCAFILVCAILVAAPSAASSRISAERPGSEPSAGSALPAPAVDEQIDPDAAADYWTSERMRSTPPAPVPEIGAEPGATKSEESPEYDASILSATETNQHPSSSVGKVFFKILGFDLSCSATAVTTAGRWGRGSEQLILTAGHCLSDGDGNFATSLVFVPGYSDGAAPRGRWAATHLFTTQEWHYGQGLAFARDVAFAVVTGTGELAGANLSEVVRPIPIVFTEPYPMDALPYGLPPRLGTEYTALGYPVEGFEDKQARNVSRVDRVDSQFSPPPLGAPSAFTGGSSGGPWLWQHSSSTRHVVNGINAYRYDGEERIYSPVLDDQIHDLWARASTQYPPPVAPGPDVEAPGVLVKSPAPRSHVRSWNRVRGVAVDRGAGASGVKRVFVKVRLKRGGARGPLGFNGHRFTAAKPAVIEVRVNSRGRWRTKKLKALTRGLLVVRYWAVDRAGNVSRTRTLKQRLSS